VALPQVRAWEAGRGEPRPEVKLAATAAVEALGTVPPGAPAEGAQAVTAAGRRLAEIGLDPALAGPAAALLAPAAPAVVQVVYPQYGGLLADDASVMVLQRQAWLQGDRVVQRDVLADVRLRRRGGRWRIRDIRPSVAPAVDAAAQPRAVRAVLESPGLSLPGPVRHDVAFVAVPELRSLLAELGGRHELAVTTLRAGHPREVYGSRPARDSNHWRGRAVDIWAVDGVPVVEMASDDPRLLDFLAEARRLGATEIGSPADPDGDQVGCRGRVFFANELHQDHIHLGIDEFPKPTCDPT
jgi:hypothetical protein